MAKKKIEEREPVYYKLYSDEELATFNLFLEKYRINKTLSDGEKISYIKWEDWLIEEGAYSKGQGGYNQQYYINDLGKYRELRDKLDQWSKWCHRRQFGKKMAEAKLDKPMEQVAESMKVRADVDN